MLKRFKSDKNLKFLFFFFVKGIALYLLWMLIYDGWLVDTHWVNKTLINHLVAVNKWLLDSFGFMTFRYDDIVGIDGSHGVFIGDPCNGLSLFALFAGFIIAFTGKIKYKIPYIFFGVLVIHALNILRIFGLTILAKYHPETLDFNHKYTFTIFIYGIIFLMWMLWVKKFALLKSSKTEDRSPKSA